MFLILRSILIGELIAGLSFTLCLFLDWLISFLKVHFQNQKKDR